MSAHLDLAAQKNRHALRTGQQAKERSKRQRQSGKGTELWTLWSCACQKCCCNEPHPAAGRFCMCSSMRAKVNPDCLAYTVAPKTSLYLWNAVALFSGSSVVRVVLRMSIQRTNISRSCDVCESQAIKKNRGRPIFFTSAKTDNGSSCIASKRWSCQAGAPVFTRSVNF